MGSMLKSGPRRIGRSRKKQHETPSRTQEYAKIIAGGFGLIFFIFAIFLLYMAIAPVV